MGRILRVIDEAPVSTFARIEAEPPPKRRGRKPGSKNKAKPASVHVPPAPTESRAVPATRTMNGREIADGLAGAAAERLAGLSLEAGVARQPKSAGAKRFAWHQDKPRPGEDWKRRRLPRACW